jgi:hypothetical protein
MPSPNELWFAARMTRIVYMPRKLLETFGETYVSYSVVSPIEGDEEHVRLRRGIVRSSRPLVVTPQYYRSQMLENFGEDAKSYLDEVLSRQDSLRIIQYGLRFMKEEHSEEVVGGEANEVADQLARSAQDDNQQVQGVLVGPDQFWEISLLIFINELVKQSAPRNVRDMARDGMFGLDRGVPLGVRQELDADFQACDTLDKAEDLGRKLRDYGLFEQYEDAFFELYMKLKG